MPAQSGEKGKTISQIAEETDADTSFVLQVARDMGNYMAQAPFSSLPDYIAEALAEEVRARDVKRQASLDGADENLNATFSNETVPSDPEVLSENGSQITRLPAEYVKETPSVQFEREMRRFLDQRFPHCALSNVLLFDPVEASLAGNPKWSSDASEMDHIMHFADEKADYLTIIECKNQPITIEKNTETEPDGWWVQYRQGNKNERKNVREQLRRHADTLRTYLARFRRGRRLEIHAIIVSSDRSTPLQRPKEEQSLRYRLISFDDFRGDPFQVLKGTPVLACQSDMLGLLRLGLPVPELGRPELMNALACIEHCRQTFDNELYKAFDPAIGHWAINGSAGMGKSVLMAYALYVFVTHQHFVFSRKSRGKNLEMKWPEAETLGIPAAGVPGVYAYTMTQRQCDVLQAHFTRICHEFSSYNSAAQWVDGSKLIRKWSGKVPNECRVLLIDEAHDLEPEDATRIAKWYYGGAAGNPRYLLMAYDRHQRLGKSGSGVSVLTDIDFKGHMTKLRLQYRSPFPIYAASLALQFRWFASEGPKVIPTTAELLEEFGLICDEQLPANDKIQLRMRSDAHPANAWAHCVGELPDSDSAISLFKSCRFGKHDVLWVRFSPEDRDFDYQRLSDYTYDSLYPFDSDDKVDKYIKGQEFPIVVIEGLPADLNTFGDAEAERRMWRRRRELYICCSRASGFLYFIRRAPLDADEQSSLAVEEIKSLVSQLSVRRHSKDGGRTWELTFTPGKEHRGLSSFDRR